MTDAVAEQDAPTAGAPRRFWPLLAAIVTAAWMSSLAWLVIATANPVTLNRRQVRDAFVTVRAEVQDVDRGTCLVFESWPARRHPGESVRVLNLREAHARAGETYLLPLIPEPSGDWRVHPAPLSNAPPLIYPVTPDAVHQIEELFPPRER